MPRRKISEYRAKKLVTKALDVPYVGWIVTNHETMAHIAGYDSYVVKVDQAVKGRFKKGLVLLKIPQVGLAATL